MDKHDFKAAREQIQQQIDQMDDDFDWSGFTVMFDGKHTHSIIAALRLAENMTLRDQRISALEEKLAMAERALRIVRAIANGDKAEIISQGYDFKSPVKLSDWCMVHIDKALSAISAKDGEK